MIAAALLLTVGASAATTDRLPVDHVMLGVADLDAGVAEVERRTGAKLVSGGSHTGLGTRNALMALGDGSYFEVLAPDPAQKVDNADIAGLRTLSTPTPIGWAMRTEDPTALTARINAAGVATTSPIREARVRPDGVRLAWQIVALAGLNQTFAPFFIAWDTMATHPSKTAPPGCRLIGLTVEDPVPEKLRRVLALSRTPVALRQAAEVRLRLDLDCPAGHVEF